MRDLNSTGRWVTVHDGGETRLVGQPKFKPGEKYLSSARFAENLIVLSRYLRAFTP